jgi:hypothetical protein
MVLGSFQLSAEVVTSDTTRARSSALAAYWVLVAAALGGICLYYGTILAYIFCVPLLLWAMIVRQEFVCPERMQRVSRWTRLIGVFASAVFAALPILKYGMLDERSRLRYQFSFMQDSADTVFRFSVELGEAIGLMVLTYVLTQKMAPILQGMSDSQNSGSQKDLAMQETSPAQVHAANCSCGPCWVLRQKDR